MNTVKEIVKVLSDCFSSDVELYEFYTYNVLIPDGGEVVEYESVESFVEELYTPNNENLILLIVELIRNGQLYDGFHVGSDDSYVEHSESQQMMEKVYGEESTDYYHAETKYHTADLSIMYPFGEWSVTISEKK